MSDIENDETLKSAKVDQFCHVTGSDSETANRTLEACGWNIELAINMHVDSIECLDTPVVDAGVEPVTNTSAATSSQNVVNDSHGEVRAPIPPVRQVLVEDGYNHSFRVRQNPASVFDAFRDFEAEARWQEELHRDAEAGQSGSYIKRRTLEDLFRPPLDLLFRGSMELAREKGSKQNKWLMVNIQNNREFQCQVLNRDVWSNVAVKSIISEHFIFWQVYHDSSDGQRYMQFYNVHQFPYVAILDPRTGEKLKSWNTIDSLTFLDAITEFLSDHPSPNGGPSNSQFVEPAALAESEKNPYEESEEMQLKAAIAASLAESSNNHNNVDNTNVCVDDESDYEAFDSDTEDSTSKVQNCIKYETPVITSKEDVKETTESWKTFLGSENAKTSELIIRFPDGKREQMSFPADSQLKALLLYISSKGYDMQEYDLITNFPKRNLKEMPSTETLSAVGLFPRETVFVQQKS
ncbi:UBX domain-containing protein 7-like protein [Leptotrombidium deliense]|uniref:UBX domain-containing protein 7-like protein n=1 Tax=Leptotrombidium deliense TaxID=299467 RepID=A0A443SD78_9ACAR|nr:UBX domain-containing protein 7-like protein [Leptotrombidium deliense]